MSEQDIKQVSSTESIITIARPPLCKMALDSSVCVSGEIRISEEDKLDCSEILAGESIPQDRATVLGDDGLAYLPHATSASGCWFSDKPRVVSKAESCSIAIAGEADLLVQTYAIDKPFSLRVDVRTTGFTPIIDHEIFRIPILTEVSPATVWLRSVGDTHYFVTLVSTDGPDDGAKNEIVAISYTIDKKVTVIGTHTIAQADDFKSFLYPSAVFDNKSSILIVAYKEFDRSNSTSAGCIASCQLDVKESKFTRIIRDYLPVQTAPITAKLAVPLCILPDMICAVGTRVGIILCDYSSAIDFPTSQTTNTGTASSDNNQMTISLLFSEGQLLSLWKNAEVVVSPYNIAMFAYTSKVSAALAGKPQLPEIQRYISVITPVTAADIPYGDFVYDPINQLVHTVTSRSDGTVVGVAFSIAKMKFVSLPTVKQNFLAFENLPCSTRIVYSHKHRASIVCGVQPSNGLPILSYLRFAPIYDRPIIGISQSACKQGEMLRATKMGKHRLADVAQLRIGAPVYATPSGVITSDVRCHIPIGYCIRPDLLLLISVKFQSLSDSAPAAGVVATIGAPLAIAVSDGFDWRQLALDIRSLTLA